MNKKEKLAKAIMLFIHEWDVKYEQALSLLGVISVDEGLGGTGTLFELLEESFDCENAPGFYKEDILEEGDEEYEPEYFCNYDRETLGQDIYDAVDRLVPAEDVQEAIEEFWKRWGHRFLV